MKDAYLLLSKKLDALPNGFPPSSDGAELRLLAKIFSPAEAELAVYLSEIPQTADQVAGQIGADTIVKDVQERLKIMTRKGLIEAVKLEQGLAFQLMPFVVGIYEAQIGRIDEEMARLFEDYSLEVFGEALKIQPTFHRVVPVNENVQNNIEVHPYESATGIVDAAQSWGVIDCICRTQKALIGEACEHPIDVCMVLSPYPDMFDKNSFIRAMTHEQAHSTLQRAASAGLVHTVSNRQKGTWYICNCCTCSCGILRGIADLGVANAVAKSPFVNTIDPDLCVVCEVCLPYCQFDALELEEGNTQVNTQRCVGCGVCVPACPEGALMLVRRPSEELMPLPKDFTEWAALRSAARGLGPTA